MKNERKIKLTKVYEGFYCGVFETKGGNNVDVFIELDEDGFYRGYCKQHKKVKTSKTVKGCVKSIEYFLNFWNY